VGAPRGTYPGGLSLPTLSSAENYTGLVYECPVGQGECGRVGNTVTPLFDGKGITFELVQVLFLCGMVEQ